MKLRLLFLPILLSLATAARAQPVFDYVNRPDPAFAWKKVEEYPLGPSLTVTHLELTSQVWEGTTWTHNLFLILPAKAQHPRVGLFYIADRTPQRPSLAGLGLMAEWLSAPVVILDHVPDQPLFGLSEDDLLAFSFTKYLATGDADWPVLFPMTKAVVRAMDAVDQYTTQNWPQPLRRFVLTGASKRGWTAWFVGEVAPQRLAGIVPMVYNNLNLPAQMAHQLASWGGYSEMLKPYTERGLPDLVKTPEGRRLAAMIDPYTYRARATMPKLIMIGTNDPYWTLDAANLYFPELPAPKYLCYMPNEGHGLGDIMGVVNAERGFFAACVSGQPLPKPAWRFVDGPSLRLEMTSTPEPKQVSVWTASAPTKDFREATWTQEVLTCREGQWTGSLPPPATGYAAIFGEFVYATEGPDLTVSTAVRIVGPR